MLVGDQIDAAVRGQHASIKRTIGGQIYVMIEH